MRPSPRPFLFLLSICIAAILGFSPASPAQTQDKPSSPEKPQTSSAPKKPVHAVAINDPIVHLAEHSSPRGSAAEPPAPQPQTAAPNDPASLPSDPAQRKAEIAALEKQIKEKRQRVELLMRLFVADEKAFLLNPTNPNEDAATREQRRYEQDELRYESAEVARLQARLDALKSLPNN